MIASVHPLNMMVWFCYHIPTSYGFKIAIIILIHIFILSYFEYIYIYIYIYMLHNHHSFVYFHQFSALTDLDDSRAGWNFLRAGYPRFLLFLFTNWWSPRKKKSEKSQVWVMKIAKNLKNPKFGWWKLQDQIFNRLVNWWTLRILPLLHSPSAS